ncbi:putative amino acid transporter [Leptomonas pyrrhocoris]|uniref:Putative amino acid transporter n=1 Tax=Leptomonas pyrrhocoris TaxID=157538 RepID=A0A0N0VFH6_LEPPY|nr:putative amino acid transporter [Leptomonas pyrrhocoris]KPA81002.1 putative amino acid transporter [Leptomonas pyrrhocoris]|eukprot:XP_015659441.1 putative amino acid transporter [Leptomonas pyrrhocoris]
MTSQSNPRDYELERVSDAGQPFSEEVIASPVKQGCGTINEFTSTPVSEDEFVSLGGDYVPGNRFSALMHRFVPHGGILSNSYNLAAVTLGSGVIALPSSFKATGIVTSILVLIVITLSTVYSVYVMMQAADKTGRRMYSYEALARGLLGRGWDYLAAFHMWMFCFGSCVSYVISTGDLLSRATDDPSVDSFIRSTWGNRVLVIVIWFCVMLPLSIPKEINSLRYFSIVGVSCMMYFVIIIIVHAAMNGFEDGRPIHEVHMFNTGNSALVGFSNFLFAFLAQTNVFEVARETPNPTPRRVTIDMAVSQTICCVLYAFAGVFGYLDFGEKVEDSILLNYNLRGDVKVAIAYVGIALKMCVGFALCMQPSRDAVYYCLGWHIPMFKDIRTVPLWLNAVICTFMSIVALVLGIFIPRVTIVFGLVGSFSGGFLGFIFPALFVMFAGNWGLKQVGWFHYICTYLLLIAGVIACVFGTVAAIYGEVK